MPLSSETVMVRSYYYIFILFHTSTSVLRSLHSSMFGNCQRAGRTYSRIWR